MIYTPDAWVILRITNKESGSTYYRCLGGWYGGFAGSDSWRLNSGITKIVDAGDYYEIFGYSGSSYHCNKRCERVTMLMQSIINQAQSEPTISVDVVDIEIVDLTEDEDREQ